MASGSEQYAEINSERAAQATRSAQRAKTTKKQGSKKSQNDAPF